MTPVALDFVAGLKANSVASCFSFLFFLSILPLKYVLNVRIICSLSYVTTAIENFV